MKIDRHFIDGIHRDPLKREFVGSILQIARASKAQVIAEGIELAEELAVLTEMGVGLVQGYLLGRRKSWAYGKAGRYRRWAACRWPSNRQCGSTPRLGSCWSCLSGIGTWRHWRWWMLTAKVVD